MQHMSYRRLKRALIKFDRIETMQHMGRAEFRAVLWWLCQQH